MNLSFPSPYQGFNYAPRLLHIRQEFFEHFLFPFAAKLTAIQIRDFLAALKPFCSGDRVTLEAFVGILHKQVPTITEQDARALFLMHQLSTQLDSEPSTDTLIPADLRSLTLYLVVHMFQQYSRQTTSLENKVKDFNVQQDHRSSYQEAFKSSSFSPLNSPRAKSLRPQTQSNECQQILYFLKAQLRTMLKFTCFNFDADDESFVSDKTINILGLLLKSENLNISAAVLDRSTKMTVANTSEIIYKNIGFNESGKQTILYQQDMYTLSGFTKSVTIKPYNSLPCNDMRIIQCEDSHIFIDHALNSLSIQQCTNCTIFISSVKFVTSVAFCDRVNVCIASNVLRIQNTIDSSFFYYGSQPPYLYGDSRSITLGPHIGNSLKIFERLREASIPISKRNTEHFRKPILLQGNISIDYMILNQEEVSSMPLPEETFGALNYQLIDECQFDTDRMGKELTEKKVLAQPLNLDVFDRILIPPLAPTEYQKAIFQRYKNFSDLQTKIRLAGIREEDSKLLQQAIQGNFREWLVTTGAIKPITDLVKLIDDQN